MIETFDKNRKVYTKIQNLQEWEHNKRAVNQVKFDALKEYLKENNGETLDPVLVNQDGFILGGRTNYLALKELGFDDVWVNLQFTESDDEMANLRVKHNNDVAYDTKDTLQDLVANFAIDWSQVSTSLENSPSIDEALKGIDLGINVDIDEESGQPAPAGEPPMSPTELAQQASRDAFNAQEKANQPKKPRISIEFANWEDLDNAEAEINEVLENYDNVKIQVTKQ